MIRHAALLLFVGLAHGQEGQTFTITVEAGKHDRRHTPVRVVIALPAALKGAASAILEDGNGRTLVGQISGTTLHFVLPELKAGQSASFKATIVRDASRVDDAFRWTDTPGESWQLAFGKRPVLRYMCKTFDESSKEARDETYKVFHHLFDPKGERLITKGPGGKFPHHRGIYYGFNKVTYGAGKTCDVWHCTGNAHQAHGKILSAEGGSVFGRHRLGVNWHGAAKEIFASEERELTVYNVPGGTLVEFVSELRPVLAPVKLDGDPQHAGFHFRADNEVNDKTAKQTYFLRPDGAGKYGETRNWPGHKDHVNLSWNAMSFVLGDQRYTVAYLDHPQNPKEARFSERDYGRFGSYFVKTLDEGGVLTVRYRLWLQSGEMKGEEVAARSADFVDPPQVTVK